MFPDFIEALRKEGAEGIVVVGVIPPKDYTMLKKAGVAVIYGLGTNILEAEREVPGLVRKVRVAA